MPNEQSSTEKELFGVTASRTRPAGLWFWKTDQLEWSWSENRPLLMKGRVGAFMEVGRKPMTLLEAIAWSQGYLAGCTGSNTWMEEALEVTPEKAAKPPTEE